MPASPTDPLASWAERLAARVAPDEIDVAPDVVAAYVEGGAAQRGLFAGPRADPGAFGAGLPLVLPSVIDALAHCSAVVREFLGEPVVSTTVATASLVVAIRQLRQGRKSELPGNEAAHVGTPPASFEPNADSPVLDPVLVDRAVTAVAALAACLQRAPVTVGSAEATADEVMAELANDPEGATRFLRAIDKANS